MSKTQKHDEARCQYAPCLDCRRSRWQADMDRAAEFEARLAGLCTFTRPCAFPEGSIEAHRYPATTCNAYVLKGQTACVQGHAV